VASVPNRICETAAAVPETKPGTSQSTSDQDVIQHRLGEIQQPLATVCDPEVAPDGLRLSPVSARRSSWWLKRSCTGQRLTSGNYSPPTATDSPRMMDSKRLEEAGLAPPSSDARVAVMRQQIG